MGFTYPLNGLVLAGGRSSRMKADKSLLTYHGISQVEHCYKLLTEWCDDVYLSNRKDQSTLSEHRKFPQIHDLYPDIGPLGGILSAMQFIPDAAWLILACDLPFIQSSLIKHLVERRVRSKAATAYRSIHEPQMPEPLCAIYEPKSQSILKESMRQGILCPRKILIHAEVEMLNQSEPGALENINNEEDHRKALGMLRKG